LGVLLFIGGLFAYFYEEQRWIFVVAPYRDLAAPLMIVGIVLLVLGYVCSARAEEERKFELLPPPKTMEVTQKICKYCGYPLPSDAKYCPSCGRTQN
jgi:ribosomal protein L40E